MELHRHFQDGCFSNSWRKEFLKKEIKSSIPYTIANQPNPKRELPYHLKKKLDNSPLEIHSYFNWRVQFILAKIVLEMDSGIFQIWI